MEVANICIKYSLRNWDINLCHVYFKKCIILAINVSCIFKTLGQKELNRRGRSRVLVEHLYVFRKAQRFSQKLYFKCYIREFLWFFCSLWILLECQKLWLQSHTISLKSTNAMVVLVHSGSLILSTGFIIFQRTIDCPETRLLVADKWPVSCLNTLKRA